MEIITVLILVVVIGFFVNNYMKGREQNPNVETIDVNADQYNRAIEELKSESNNMEDQKMEEKKGTRDLFLETLTKIVVVNTK